jgi:hypothetical protein
VTDSNAIDFFTRLERELRVAGVRRHRRWRGWVPASRAALTSAAAVAVLGLGLVPALSLLGGETGPEDSHLESSGGDPAPLGTVVNRGGESHTVVATGSAPLVGSWQMETYTSKRLVDPETAEVYQPAGLRCLGLFLVDPPPLGGAGGGQCGEFPSTPGFSRIESAPSNASDRRELLVYGRAPEEASAIVLTGEDGFERRTTPMEGLGSADGDYYLFAVPYGVGGRVNWLDANGEPGSRGLALLPR